MVSKRRFNKIKEEKPESKIWKRTWEEQDTRNDLAKVLKKERKLNQKWEWLPNKLKNKKNELNNKLLEHDVKKIDERIDNNEFTEEDLLFLEENKCTNLLKDYRNHRLTGIKHSAWNWGITTSSWYPYKPQYTFLYELCKDNPQISESKKEELREKADKEVRVIVHKEIENDTILYEKPQWFVKHLSIYIPQKEFAELLINTGNMWTSSNIDILVEHLDEFDELDNQYKEEIRERHKRWNYM